MEKQKRKQAKPGEPIAWVRSYINQKHDCQCTEWPFGTFGDGYAAARDETGKLWRVARLVCVEVHGEPNFDAAEAAHSCGKGHLGCINPNHLRWATSKENADDRRKHGTINKGTRNGMAVLSEEIVLAIYSYKNKGYMQKEIGALFGVAREQVKNIWNGTNWSWLTGENGKKTARQNTRNTNPALF